LHHLAIEQYKKAISLNPDSAKYTIILESLWPKWGRLDEAISQFQLGLRFHPEDQELRKNLEHALRLKSTSLKEDAKIKIEAWRTTTAGIAIIRFLATKRRSDPRWNGGYPGPRRRGLFLGNT